MLTVVECQIKRDGKILVYDGYDTTGILITTMESDVIPDKPIRSTSNIMFIQFDIESFSETKFKFQWAQVAREEVKENVTDSLNCTSNSVITVHKSVNIHLTSPGYPFGYADGLNCKWTFLPAEQGYHVSAIFPTIDLESTTGCVADYVKVSSSSDLVNFNSSEQLCNVEHGIFNTRFDGTPYLRIEFQSDYYLNRTGFDSIVSLECGGVLEGTEGYITSGMTNRTTPVLRFNDSCDWTVNVRRGRTIRLVIESMGLQKNPDGTCNNYLIFRNGISDDAPFLGNGKYCGEISEHDTLPVSTSNIVRVQYVRPRWYIGNTFRIKYEQVEHDCGGYVTLSTSENSTIITSPNYPNIPNPHIECIWRVVAPNGELIKIEFLERFDFTQSPGCVSEYLEIREGSVANSPLVERFCNEQPDTLHLSSNMARLKYFTDISVPRNGFKARVSFTRCGKSISATKGYITSPGYPAQGN